ncbi:endonuclease/exonuclease/phosphatase family protein, partial [Desulfobacterales bacterium HSG17]|nr:endonuclease/exonuclease/phosphatase family protein [Desulfobacterales bacterium HSG17]
NVFSRTVLLIWIILSLTGCAGFNPPPIQTLAVSGPMDGPLLQPGQKITVMSFNVQYMAGKNYVFFYDMLDGSGKDSRPSPKDITATFGEVARVIRETDPDIILLQEMDEGAKRTDYEDQLERLLRILPSDYRFHTSAFYWKSNFVPHPKIMGETGMKLSTISKYRITNAKRYQLALREVGALEQKFQIKRALLETRIGMQNGNEFSVMNTHLAAFAQGEDTMQRQVKFIKDLLDKYTAANIPFIIGGDFNLLPNTEAYMALNEYEQEYYQKNSELDVLTKDYPSIPTQDEMTGPKKEKWFTHFANNPKFKGPDRTIDYVFYSRMLKPGDHFVMQDNTLHISDHLPLVMDFEMP